MEVETRILTKELLLPILSPYQLSCPDWDAASFFAVFILLVCPPACHPNAVINPISNRSCLFFDHVDLFSKYFFIKNILTISFARLKVKVKSDFIYLCFLFGREHGRECLQMIFEKNKDQCIVRKDTSFTYL